MTNLVSGKVREVKPELRRRRPACLEASLKKVFGVALGSCLFLAGPTFSSLSEAKPDKLNVLLITIDTLRADRLSCYSSESIRTPNIDSLAARGAMFSRAFANTSTTLPSHTNILLGTTPLYHGVHDNLNFVVPEDSLTLAEHLKNFGYSTLAFVGAYPLDSRFGLAQGFDVYDDNYARQHFKDFSSLERRAETVVSLALDRIKGVGSPWFIWIHCYDPHVPYDPPEPFKTQSANPYDGEVAYVDFALGKLLDYLQQNNLYEKTVIVFTSDHGESLGQHGEMTHGFFAYNPTMWVPLIVCIPGIGSGKIDQVVSHLDIFPTVCQAVGVDTPSFLQGTSLLPAIKGKRLSARPVYIESLYPYYNRGWAPLRGFIFGQEKFLESPIPEVYDLAGDFAELRNLAGEKDLGGYKKRLEDIVQSLSLSESSQAKRQADAETRAKLASLGYISSSQSTRKEKYGPEDDVKTLLPYENRSQQAMDLYSQGKTGPAIEILEGIIKERKDINIVYNRLAILYQKEKRLDKALEILKEGLKNLPSNYEIFGNYIKLLRAAGQPQEVVRLFGSARFPEAELDPEIWSNLGFAYARLGDSDKAVKAYEQALSLDSRYAEAYYNLGDTLYSQAVQKKSLELLKKAQGSFTRAAEIDPGYPAPYYGLGKCERVAGNLDKAIENWEKALKLEPNFDRVIYLLGLAYLEIGNKNKALEEFTLLKENFSSHYPQAQRAELEDLIRKCKERP
jgi:arylsulfatase A-like enzyme/Tfp pilus assembly protein PilF